MKKEKSLNRVSIGTNKYPKENQKCNKLNYVQDKMVEQEKIWQRDKVKFKSGQ